MKVIHVIDTLKPGGAERVLVEMTNLLSQKLEQVDVLCLNEPGPLSGQLPECVQLYTLNRGFKGNPAKLWQFSRQLRGYDIVHVHMRHVLRYTYLADWLFKIPANIVFHDHFGNITKDSGIYAFTKKAIQAYPYIGVSRDLTKWSTDSVGKPANEVFLLSNFVMKQEVAPSPKKSDKNYRLVTVGNISERKNTIFAVRLLAMLNQYHPASLDVYGGVGDQQYLKTLQKEIEHLGLNKKVRINHEITDIQAYLPQYDLALHTATSETGPLVLIEYLCQGIPFLTYDTGQVVQQVKGDLSKWILTGFDPQRWLDRILGILTQENDTGCKDLNAVYHKHFSPTTYYSQCKAIYDQVIATS